MFALHAIAVASSYQSRCVEESRSVAGAPNMTCSQAFERIGSCARLYEMGWRCCLRCDPCGIDGRACAADLATPRSGAWISPRCSCDQVVVTGACSYRGCAKPDALGVFTKRSGWRTPDGRHVYVKDGVQPSPGQGLHADAFYHRSFDDSSGANRSGDGGVYLYYLRSQSRWVVGPRATLDDDAYARSMVTDAACPTQANSWSFWWGGGVSPLSLRTAFAGGVSYYSSTARGWVRPAKYPLSIACWASPPSPPPPPPRPPPPPPPPPPMPPPPLRLVPGPFTGRLEVFYSKPGSLIGTHS